MKLQQRRFGPVTAQLATVEGLLETSIKQFDAPAPGIERQHLPIGESRGGDARHQMQRMAAVVTRDQSQHQVWLVTRRFSVGPEIDRGVILHAATDET